MTKQQRKLIREGIAPFLFLIFFLLYLLLPPVTPHIRDLLLVLTVIMGVHLVERFLLWRSIMSLITESVQAALEILRSAAVCGLTGVYTNREGAPTDIIKAIEGARKTIWLLGVAFSEKITLEQLLPELVQKKRGNPEFNVKILLLDPLRSPAIFRTFLESPVNALEAIVRFYRQTLSGQSPLLGQKFYDDLGHAFTVLSWDENAILQDSVRFYAHNPNCWLVIADDTAYFEPYTFGKPSNIDPSNRCIGPYMPVFKFQRGPNGKPFEILEDHFLKLWRTSDIDWFHFKNRWADKERFAKEIFRIRLPWLEGVYKVLSMWQSGDSRQSPRQRCESNPQTGVRLEWEDSNVGSLSCGAVVHDFSREGISVQLTVPNPATPTIKAEVILKVVAPVLQIFAREAMRNFANRKLEVRWISPTAPLIAGLKRIA